MNKEISNANGHLTDATFCSPSGHRGIRLSRAPHRKIFSFKRESPIVTKSCLLVSRKPISPKNMKVSKRIRYINLYLFFI